MPPQTQPTTKVMYGILKKYRNRFAYHKLNLFRIGLFLLLYSQRVTYGDPSLVLAKPAAFISNQQYANHYKQNFFIYPTHINESEFYNLLKSGNRHGTAIESAVSLHTSGINNSPASVFEFVKRQCSEAEKNNSTFSHEKNYRLEIPGVHLEKKVDTQDTSTRIIGWRPSTQWKVSLISQYHFDDYPSAFSPKEIVSYSEDERQGAYLQISWLY